MSDASKAAKRPAEDDRAAAGLEPLGQSLREQISAFEQLGDAPPEHVAKKASKVHSLTQNTTHRKIRIGPEYQAVLPPPPPPRK
ncbi:hypothetical protein ABPG77_006811 [Micractinium sp. CCAP 211/92]